MSRERLLMLIGILVLVSPFIGLPLSILTWVLPLLGGLTLGIGASYAMRKRNLQNQQHPQIASYD